METVNIGLYIHQASNLLITAHRVIVELTESVEFKSLPSGLHHVEEDLVYVYEIDSWRAVLSKLLPDISFMMRTMLALAPSQTNPLLSLNATR